MAKHISLTSTFHLFTLAIVIALTCAHAARILTEDDPADTPAQLPAPELLPPMAGPPAAAASTASPAAAEHPPPLTFFMHDILGGSNPSARVEAGIVANTQANALPFTKTNGGVFPISGGVPLVTANGNNAGILNNNNNNLPFAGLTGASPTGTTTVLQNNGNNNLATNGDAHPFVTPGQLPAGATLQKLIFGTITVIDDELTEGHEIGTSVVGRAQGFYLASSLDGSSQTMAFTALFHEGGDHREEGEEDTLSFFGVHRTAAPESHIAVVGGTGKYENAKGYALIETLHPTDQHTTDGVETLLHVSVFVSDNTH